ncbi:MAG: DUF3307 domain-containing protein [Proteobacteria bacterium]|nr:DUF3307 domain-containing protein [Pseudomonadota bacterium]
MSLETALWALLAFQIKHYLCDFVLQSGYQVRTKGIYGHPGGFIHSGLHIITSIPALLILGADARGIAIAMAAEFVVHYHTDWTKSQIDRRTQWGFDDARHWMVFGADQLIHQLTYWGMIWVFAFGL